MTIKKSKLAERIDEVLSNREQFLDNAYSKSLEELIEELKIYQYELEFQNDELRRVQEDLELSRDQFQQLFQEAPVGYVMLGPDFKILECNLAFRSNFAPEGECEQKLDFRMLVLPEDQDKFHHFHKKLEKLKETIQTELRFLRKDGKIAYLSLYGRRMNTAGKRVFLLSTVDLTEQKKTETKLKVKDEELQLILDYMSDLLLMSDREGSIVYSSPSCQQFGYTVDEMKTMKLFDFVHPDDLPMVLERFNKALENRHEDSLEFRSLNKDGSYGWVETAGNILLDKQGNITGLIFSIRNISKRKAIEHNLAESDRFLLDTGRLAQVGGWKLEWPSGEVYWSQVTREIHEEDPNRKVTLDTGLTYYPEGEQRDRIQFIVKQSIEMGYSFDEELEIITPKGNRKWVRVLGKPVFENEVLVRLIGTFQDITERKHAQNVLRESEAKYRLITENSSDVIWIYNLNQNRFTYVSPSIIQLRGFTPEEAMQESLSDALTPDSFESVSRSMDTYLPEFLESKNDQTSRRLTEMKQPCKDGRIIWVEASTQFQFNNAGELEVFGVSRDISERKRLEQEVRESEAKLRELNFTKDKLFSIIAHDLRSPFTSFLGLTEMMMAYDIQFTLTEMREMAATLYKSAHSTYNLLENLLEWSRLQRGMIKPEPQFVMLEQMIGKVLDVFEEQRANKELTFHHDIPPKLLVYTDEKMMETVFRNLLSNAIKFSNRGGDVHITARKSERNTVLVSIMDNGIGIPQTLVPKLFEVDEAKSRKGTEGERSTGLGLMLCKEFVELNNAHIRVESLENEGSEFLVELPRY
jgi:PAS domain S-box-containing protein